MATIMKQSSFQRLLDSATEVGLDVTGYQNTPGSIAILRKHIRERERRILLECGEEPEGSSDLSESEDQLTTEEAMIWNTMNTRLLHEIIALKTGLEISEVRQIISDMTPKSVNND